MVVKWDRSIARHPLFQVTKVRVRNDVPHLWNLFTAGTTFPDEPTQKKQPTHRPEMKENRSAFVSRSKVPPSDHLRPWPSQNHLPTFKMENLSSEKNQQVPESIACDFSKKKKIKQNSFCLCCSRWKGVAGEEVVPVEAVVVVDGGGGQGGGGTH